MGKILDDSELSLFDSIASDLNTAAGTAVNYYSVNRKKSKIDPLFGEYENRVIDGPFGLDAWFQWPNQAPVVGEAGFTVEFDCTCVISRIHLDNISAPYPTEGDVIETWRTPYHDIQSLGKGMFFDIIKVNYDGHINDSPTFVQFKLWLKRRPQFAAERRITPP